MINPIPEVNIKEQVCYLIPIGDIHVGSPDFSQESINKLRGYVQFVKDNPNARILGMGDYLDVATRHSKTSPHTATMTLSQGLKFLKNVFYPVRKQIVGLIDGNHEFRLEDFAGYNPVESLADMLGVPHLGIDALLRFNVGKRKPGKGAAFDEGESYRTSFYVYAHHSTGGGGTVGGKVNRCHKLAELVEGCDLYCAGHNHALSCDFNRVTVLEKSKGTYRLAKRAFVLTGGYVDWHGGYAHRMQLQPTKLGSPRVRLSCDNSGHKKDIHVNL
jgi:hypothetical protein